MFWHNFKYSLKTLLKNKMLLFWTFAFPIVLGTFFYMAFSNIEKTETLDAFDIAIVNNNDFNENILFKEAFKSLSDKTNDNYLFNIKYVNLNEAKNLLEEEKIVGYLYFSNDNVNVTVNSSGIDETVLRFVTNELLSKKEIINTLVEVNYAKAVSDADLNEIYKEAINIINNSDVTLNNISNKNLSYTNIEYYTLIAMSALYGAMISITVINYKLPNMNSVGKRCSISPLNKKTLLISSLLASYLVQIVGLLILFIFMLLVMHVDFGNNGLLVLLLGLVGSLTGLSLGIFIGSVIKTNENAKTGILISITMLWCFLSGMMGITMKYVIDKNVPIINKINPAALLTDGFYALYYYDTLNRYVMDVISLVIISLVLILLSLGSLRRQKYDSI